MTGQRGSALERVQAALEARGSHRAARGMWQCPVPEHDDHDPSLSVKQGSDGALVKCQSRNCALEEIIGALGLDKGALFDKPLAKAARPQVVAEYPYLDEQSAPLYTIKRLEPGHGGKRKSFLPYLPGAAKPGLGGARRVPYRLPELLAAVKAGEIVYVVEGEKSADALRAHGVTATTNPNGAGKWRPEFDGYFAGARVVVVADRDDDGVAHAREVATHLGSVARSVMVVQSAVVTPKADIVEHLEARLSVEQLVPLVVTAVPTAEATPAGEAAGDQDYDGDGRLMVQASHRNPVDAADEVAEHVLKDNDPPRLFSMSPAAVLLKDGGELVPLDDDGWLLYVARRVTFTVPANGGTSRTVAPPASVMKLTPAVVIPELPPLDGVATTPYLDRGGNLISADGYDKGTRRILHTGGLRLPDIPAEPSAEEVSAAVKLLNEEWLGDLPFASPADKANAIAVPLTLTGRMFYSLVPLFVLDASTSGSGKGLLAKTTSIIVTGDVPAVMELPEAGEEQRKKITSALLAGQELIMWDESHVIAGRTLAAILTAERYSDRLLGGNKIMSAVNRFTMIALGNNVQVRGDMKRRAWPVRLVPAAAHPEHRTGFRHADLDAWVRVNRGELLGAVLTIWRNWIAKGRPEADVTLGSFERWGRAVGGALQAAGISGFGANVAEWLTYSEDDDGGWSTHLIQLQKRFGERWSAVSDVAEAVGAGYLKRPPVKHDLDKDLSLQRHTPTAASARPGTETCAWSGPASATPRGRLHLDRPPAHDSGTA